MQRQIVEATAQALRDINSPRLFKSERGFQGEFYCQLRAQLQRRNILQGDLLLEVEYQKGGRHGTRQRPDIILHIPAEYRNANVRENNMAVWALKRRASAKDAYDDFLKLDQMFELLRYPMGFFINIDSNQTWAGSYMGNFPDRLHAIAARLEDNGVQVCHSSPS